jgi:hypothetical protein
METLALAQLSRRTTRAGLCALVACALLTAVRAAEPATMPKRIEVCETAVVQYCGEWSWNGREYEGHWENGIVATLRVQHLAADGILITRVDSAGPSPGLTATYTGNLDGDRVSDGKVVWVFKGRSYKGTWTGTLRHE